MKIRYFLFSLIFVIILFDFSYSMKTETISARGYFFKWMPKTLPSNYITCMINDPYDDNHLYIGTNEGLTWTNGKIFRWYGNGKLPGPQGKNINDIYIYDKKYLFVATDSSLSKFSFLSDKWIYFTKKNGLPTDCIQCISSMGGNLLVGTWGEGIYQMRLSDNRFREVKIPGFNGKYITDILVDKELKKIIIGTMKNGLAVYENEKWSLINTKTAKIPSNRINALAGDGTKFYAGTNSGLIEFSSGRIKIYSTLDRLNSDNILSLFHDANNLYIGTDKGINHLKEGKIKSYVIKNSLSRGKPVRILSIIDASGVKYLGTQHCGLLKSGKVFKK